LEAITFKDLGVHEDILKALEKEGYTHPTPIQEAAIPHMLGGHDVLGCAQTGTGKTAAFAISDFTASQSGHLSMKRSARFAV
jgi:ATP-dependent RNA helicase RhlE